MYVMTGFSLPDAARRERTALAACLRDSELHGQADVILAAVAPGYRLVPAVADTDAMSRLGGSGLLPAGEPWPTDRHGTPLSFLAGVCLAELDGSAAVDAGLPASGWLLAFGAVGDPGLGLGLGERNEAGASFRVVITEGGAEPADQQAQGAMLVERRVRPLEQLTLPDSYEAAQALVSCV